MPRSDGPGPAALARQIRADLPATITTEHSAAAGRDVNATADGGGVATGAIHGPVASSAGGLAIAQLEQLILAWQRPELIGRPVTLPPRPAPLAGREVLLADIHDRLTGGDAPWPRIAALHGLGGAGKTSVAVEYAHRHLAEVGVAWLLPAENRTTLEAAFTPLAALLAAGGGLVAPGHPVASVHAALAASPLPWLLIFDNAPDPDQYVSSCRQLDPARC